MLSRICQADPSFVEKVGKFIGRRVGVDFLAKDVGLMGLDHQKCSKTGMVSAKETMF